MSRLIGVSLQIDFDALMLMREDDFDKLKVSFGQRVKLRNLQRCEYSAVRSVDVN